MTETTKNIIIERDEGGKFKKGHKSPGRKPGAKNKETISKEKALVEYQQQMLRVMKPIMIAQIQSAQGLCVILKPKLIKNPKTGKMERSGELRQVKDTEEIIRLLEASAKEEVLVGEDYHIVWAKDPNVKAIKDIWEMVFGKPQDSIKIEHKGKVIILNK